MDERCTRLGRHGTIDDLLSELTGVLANQRLRIRRIDPKLSEGLAKHIGSLER